MTEQKHGNPKNVMIGENPSCGSYNLLGSLIIFYFIRYLSLDREAFGIIKRKALDWMLCED